MKAMILAAGRGKRMKELTDNIPKALITVANKPLIVYQIEALVRAGITELVINLSYKGEQIKQALGNGSEFGAQIIYSDEGEDHLETGGGIFKALSHLQPDPFIVINCDLWTDYPYHQLPKTLEGDAHIILVANPSHNPNGDFNLCENNLIQSNPNPYTFSGIGVYHPSLFKACKAGYFRLAPLLRQAIQQEMVTGECYTGTWIDVGTPERLDLISCHPINSVILHESGGSIQE